MVARILIAIIGWVAGIYVTVSVLLHVSDRENPYDAKMWKRYYYKTIKEALKEIREEDKEK